MPLLLPPLLPPVAIGPAARTVAHELHKGQEGGDHCLGQWRRTITSFTTLEQKQETFDI